MAWPRSLLSECFSSFFFFFFFIYNESVLEALQKQFEMLVTQKEAAPTCTEHIVPGRNFLCKLYTEYNYYNSEHITHIFVFIKLGIKKVHI